MALTPKEIPNDLLPSLIAMQLRTQRIGRSLDVRAQTISTMDDAKEAAEHGAQDGHTIVADHQTQGRGAHGRTWSSPPNTDLYISIVTRPAIEISRLAPITLAIGLAVAETVEHFTPSAVVEVKWPNDVWLNGRKCAGILVESTTNAKESPVAIVGIGLNVLRTEWPPDLMHLATSIKTETLALQTSLPSRAFILASLLNHLERWLDLYVIEGMKQVLPSIERRLALRGQKVKCNAVSGVIEGVAPSGALKIRSEERIHEIVSGTLEWQTHE